MGRLKPVGEVIDIGAIMGDRLARLLVAQGDFVKQGQPLAELDSHACGNSRSRRSRYNWPSTDKAHAELKLAEAPLLAAQLGVERIEFHEAEIQAEELKLPVLKQNWELAKRDLRTPQRAVAAAGLEPGARAAGAGGRQGRGRVEGRPAWQRPQQRQRVGQFPVLFEHGQLQFFGLDFGLVGINALDAQLRGDKAPLGQLQFGVGLVAAPRPVVSRRFDLELPQRVAIEFGQRLPLLDEITLGHEADGPSDRP